MGLGGRLQGSPVLVLTSHRGCRAPAGGLPAGVDLDAQRGGACGVPTACADPASPWRAPGTPTPRGRRHAGSGRARVGVNQVTPRAPRARVRAVGVYTSMPAGGGGSKPGAHRFVAGGPRPGPLGPRGPPPRFCRQPSDGGLRRRAVVCTLRVYSWVQLCHLCARPARDTWYLQGSPWPLCGCRAGTLASLPPPAPPRQLQPQGPSREAVLAVTKELSHPCQLRLLGSVQGPEVGFASG